MAAKRNSEETKPRVPGEVVWRQVVTDGADRQSWDFRNGPADGKLRSVKVVMADYEGVKRERVLAVIESFDAFVGTNIDTGEAIEVAVGEKLNVWAPAMMQDELRSCIGRRIRITRTGEGKRDTRYQVEVAS